MKNEQNQNKNLPEIRNTQYPSIYNRSTLMLSSMLGIKVFTQLLHQTQTNWDKISQDFTVKYSYFVEDIFNSFPEYKRLHTPEMLHKTTVKMLQKVTSVTLVERGLPAHITRIVSIWQGAEIDREQDTIKITPSIFAAEILEKEFYSLIAKNDVLMLNNSKSVKLYLLLSQYQNTKIYRINWEELALMLGVNDKYIKKNSTAGKVFYDWKNISRYVLDSAVIELRKRGFPYLHYSRQGGTFTFSWK
jgi:hypothetical protein